MNKLALIALLLLFATAGCSRYYQITLNNGHRITTIGKPKYERGNYVFRDITGHTNYVSEGSIAEIGPRPRGYSEDSAFNPSGRK